MRLLRVDRNIRHGKSIYRLHFVHGGRLQSKCAIVSDCYLSVSKNIVKARERAIVRAIREAASDFAFYAHGPEWKKHIESFAPSAREKRMIFDALHGPEMVACSLV